MKGCLTFIAPLGLVASLVISGCSSDEDGTSRGNAGSSGDAAAGDAAGSGGIGGSGGTSAGGSGGTSAGGSAGTSAGGSAGTSTGGSAGASGSGGTGGSVVPADCTELCEKRIALGCPNDPTLADCERQCAYEGVTVKYCQAEWQALLDCANAPETVFACDASGFSTAEGCDDEKTEAGRCTLCVGDESDDLCDLCRKQRCCAETEAFLDAPGSLDLIDCVDGCSGSNSCVTACMASYPDAASAATAVTTCGQEQCPVACGGTVPDAGASNEPLTAYCAAELASGCASFSSVEDCITQISDAGSMIGSFGCGLVFNLQLICAANEGVECTDAGAASPTCPELFCDMAGTEDCDAYWELNGVCGIGCESWFGSCEPAAGGLDCVCDLGPNAGTTFHVGADCSSGAAYAQMESNCKPQ